MSINLDEKTELLIYTKCVNKHIVRVNDNQCIIGPQLGMCTHTETTIELDADAHAHKFNLKTPISAFTSKRSLTTCTLQ